MLLLIVLSAGYWPVNTQDLPADPGHYLDSLKTALRRVWPHNRTINLVFDGHSVPAGYQANHQVHTFESYPFLLLKKLKAAYPYAVINVIITAVGGQNSQQGEQRFAGNVLIHEPDVLFIDYALNDQFISLSAARSAWEKMILEALRRHIKIILLTPSPDQRVHILARGNKLDALSVMIRDLAAKYHIALADPFSRFQEIERSGGNIKDYMSWVNHPNKKGNEIIAGELVKWFE